MDKVNSILIDLLSKEHENCSHIYPILVNLKVNDEQLKNLDIISKLYLLYDRGILRKDLVLISLLINEDKRLFERVIEFEKSTVQLNLKETTSLFDYTYQKKEHWFLEIIKNDFTNLENVFNEETLGKINLIKLMYYTHLEKIDLNKIENIINKIDLNEVDELKKIYINELQQILNVINFCLNVTEEKPNISELYYCAWNESVLNVLSKYVNLREFSHWDAIKQLIENEELFLKQTYNQSTKNGYTQMEIFTTFTIFSNIIKSIKLCHKLDPNDSITKSNISYIIEETKRLILEIKNDILLIQILEDIFALVFMKDLNETNFFCKENELFLTILFLKSLITQIKTTRSFEKCSDVYKRLHDLNDYVTDALWRLELITSIEKSDEDYSKTSILTYMLASPDALINICLKKENFEKANQVIQIFNLNETYLVKEIHCTEKLRELRKLLKKAFKLKSIKKEYPLPYDYNVSIEQTIEDHFKKANFINDETDKIITENPENSYSLQSYHSKYNKLMDLFDLTITSTHSYEESMEYIKIYQKYFDCLPENENLIYHNFLTKSIELFQEYAKENNESLLDILVNPIYNFDITKQRKEDDLYKQLIEQYDLFNNQIIINENGILNQNHVSHKTFLKLQEISLLLMKLNNNNDDNREIFKYLQRLYYYLKTFSKIFYIETNNTNLLSHGKNVSFFEILNTTRHELTGKLIFDRNLLPSELEQFFIKIKLDLCYHIAANCFPIVYFHNSNKDDVFYYDTIKFLRKPNKDLLTYIQKRNWLLGFVINEIHKVETRNIHVNEPRIKYIFNYINLPTIQNLKEMYDDNEFILAFQHKIDVKLIEKYFDEIIKENDLDELKNKQFSELSTESCEEVSEDYLKSTTNWKHLFNIIDNIPQLQFKENNTLNDLYDIVVCNLISDRYEPEYYKYVQYIKNDDLRINIILSDMMHWPGQFCMDIIQSELSRFKSISKNYYDTFKDFREKIKLYEQLKCVFPHKSWHDIKELCDKNPSNVLTSLLQVQEVDTLIFFINVYKIEEYLYKIDLNYFLSLFDVNVPLHKIEILFNKLSTIQVTDICQNLLKLLRNLEYLQFITNFLLKITNEDVADLSNIKISLKILSYVQSCDQDQLWCLIYEPISIIEVFLMNTKLDKLGQIIEAIRPDLTHSEYDENVISIEKIDEILRHYAEKSLDFRVITQPNPRLLRTPESKLMQSLDSLNIGPEKKDFEMPDIVPDKSEWIENSEVVECMCCQETIFSMFNRRHHCRRCGRVVCWSCSTKRMLVPTYEDILVRVCIDCYEQTHGDAGTSIRTDTTLSSFCDAWLLTDDSEHNAIIREEFSYEHAPSVSLCLAILKNHSQNIEYPKFVLSQCDEMLKLLQPIHADSLGEIDYMLVIKMLKSLAMAAKMLCAQSTLQWGVTLADRILTQADLLALLVERGCLNLLPHSTQKNNPYIDSAVLRRLRDKLLEREQWNLALEVSTKAGLDNTGVFAAWGKSCLKAGRLYVAREKFQRCFDRILHSTSDYYLSSESDSSTNSLRVTRHLRMSSVSDTKPIRTPPLLKEIIQILESNCTPIDTRLLKEVKNNKLQNNLNKNRNQSAQVQNDIAICILNKLKNLNAIAAGNYYSISEESLQNKKPFIEPIFYSECIFYLQKYGSHLGLLEFYVKHGEFHDALLYIIENHLHSDIFIEIYMICLKSGVVNKLQENMSTIDSTLNLWKDYLNNICRHLEKQSLFHSLYQLQQFMCDYVRASMTCIKFYTENVFTFAELLTRVKYLYKSQEHLKQELDQEQWIEVTAVQRMSTSSEETFEEKMVVNPSLILKMDAKSIERCIEIVNLQIEVVQFLAECELKKPLVHFIPKINTYSDEVKTNISNTELKIPTLIHNANERIQLAVLAVIAGERVIDGFGFAYKIIQECKLKPIKVYCQAGKILAEEKRYSALAQLVGCIQHTGEKDSAVTYECDEMLLLAVRTISNSAFDPHQVDELVKFITDKGTKINAYIECKQLKSAFMLALKFNRAVDIRRIMHEAELLNKPDVRKLCKKALLAHTHSPTNSKEAKKHSK